MHRQRVLHGAGAGTGTGAGTGLGNVTGPHAVRLLCPEQHDWLHSVSYELAGVGLVLGDCRVRHQHWVHWGGRGGFVRLYMRSVRVERVL